MAARGLGKGLDTLIPNAMGDMKKNSAPKKDDVVDEKGQETIVKITKVEPNREQPRKNFDEEALKELADSIKQFGLLQPILVQDRKTYYEIGFNSYFYPDLDPKFGYTPYLRVGLIL